MCKQDHDQICQYRPASAVVLRSAPARLLRTCPRHKDCGTPLPVDQMAAPRKHLFKYPFACRPNCVASFDNAKLCLRVALPVQAGKALSVSYGPQVRRHCKHRLCQALLHGCQSCLCQSQCRRDLHHAALKRPLVSLQALDINAEPCNLGCCRHPGQGQVCTGPLSTADVQLSAVPSTCAGAQAGLHATAWRQRTLLDDYGFHCACQECVNGHARDLALCGWLCFKCSAPVLPLHSAQNSTIACEPLPCSK